MERPVDVWLSRRGIRKRLGLTCVNFLKVLVIHVLDLEPLEAVKRSVAYGVVPESCLPVCKEAQGFA